VERIAASTEATARAYDDIASLDSNGSGPDLRTEKERARDGTDSEPEIDSQTQLEVQAAEPAESPPSPILKPEEKSHSQPPRGSTKRSAETSHSNGIEESQDRDCDAKGSNTSKRARCGPASNHPGPKPRADAELSPTGNDAVMSDTSISQGKASTSPEGSEHKQVATPGEVQKQDEAQGQQPAEAKTQGAKKTQKHDEVLEHLAGSKPCTQAKENGGSMPPPAARPPRKQQGGSMPPPAPRSPKKQQQPQKSAAETTSTPSHHDGQQKQPRRQRAEGTASQVSPSESPNQSPALEPANTQPKLAALPSPSSEQNPGTFTPGSKLRVGGGPTFSSPPSSASQAALSATQKVTDGNSGCNMFFSKGPPQALSGKSTRGKGAPQIPAKMNSAPKEP